MKRTVLILIGIVNAVAVFAQPLTTQSISVFKNNQAFYQKSGALKSTNGKFLLPDPAPQALYGTLWFNSLDGSLSRVASYPDTLREQKTEAAVAVWDLLRNNIGKTMAGFVGDEEGASTVTGKIVSVGPIHKDEKGELYYGPASLVTLQSQQGNWTTIPASQINYVSFSEKPMLEVSMPKLTPRHLIELSFNNNKTEQPFEMLYLANGLKWAPEYLLELTSDNAGTLSLQGEVVNKAEDINNTTLNLVVGVPNFVFANRLDYLVDFLGMMGMGNPEDYSAISNIRGSRSQTPQYYLDGVGLNGSLPEEEEIEVSRNEDLFFYTLKNFSLKKGGRSIQPIFKENVEVKHIYECVLPSSEVNQPFEQEFLFAPQINHVYHTLMLQNKTNQPWTTASVLVVNNQGGSPTGTSRPLSQDQLNYTPAGGQSYVKLTEAVEVKVEQAEREISREKGAVSDKRYGLLDLVQVEGKIKVRNFKDKDLNLRLQRSITGNLKKSSAAWTKNEVINPNNPRNRQANVVWETTIKANGELEIVYTYEVYIQSY